MNQNDVHLQLYADGACRGNPGEGGAGFVILDADGELVFKAGKYLGHCTNNIAEYEALILGIQESLARKCTHLSIFLDSELLVKQINGEYRVKNERLKKLHGVVKGLLSRLKCYSIRHQPRGQNRLADYLANSALDAAVYGKSPQHHGSESF